jgi:hypothetical protein
MVATGVIETAMASARDKWLLVITRQALHPVRLPVAHRTEWRQVTPPLRVRRTPTVGIRLA